VPAHAKPSRHPSRWALVAAVAAVAALVAVVRPAMGHDVEPAAAPAPSRPAVTTEPATESAAPAPTTTEPEPTPTTPPPTTQAPIPASASGRLAVVPGEVAPAGPGTPLRYELEVEAGLPLDGAAIAAQVHRILTDPRGWQPIERVAFGRTSGPADFELIIASPTLVDRLCYPLDTVGQLSCRNGNKVILNARRWATAVPWYAGNMDAYRAYLVNHEVGHRLGHGHKTCPSPGAPAPVMVQQSKSLYGCKANPWPSVAY
jgi:hypothetical protein